MRNGGHIPDQFHLKAGGLQGPQGRFPPCSRAFNKYVHGAHAVFHSLFGRFLRRQLRGKGRAFPRSFKPLGPGTGPGHNVPNGVRNGDNGIVKGGLDVDNP